MWSSERPLGVLSWGTISCWVNVREESSRRAKMDSKSWSMVELPVLEVNADSRECNNRMAEQAWEREAVWFP